MQRRCHINTRLNKALHNSGRHALSAINSLTLNYIFNGAELNINGTLFNVYLKNLDIMCFLSTLKH